MTQRKRVTRSEASRSSKSASAKRARARAGRLRRKPPKGKASASKAQAFTLHKIAEFYRPLKKPVTLRLDADVIAWFKKDGRRYQTRINQALRKVMEREMNAAG
jgi:uncharacterized protein (DUF4415 family)